MTYFSYLLHTMEDGSYKKKTLKDFYLIFSQKRETLFGYSEWRPKQSHSCDFDCD